MAAEPLQSLTPEEPLPREGDRLPPSRVPADSRATPAGAQPDGRLLRLRRSSRPIVLLLRKPQPIAQQATELPAPLYEHLSTTVPALFALRLRAELHSWLEVRAVEARANVVGTIHERYEAGAVTELDGPRARDFTTAANAAWRFVREPTLRLAFKDLGFSLRDRGDDAFLYAYRAVENAGRFHAAKVSAAETTPVWPPLHAALGTSEAQLQPLTDAAASIRHGDTKSAALAAPRVNRDATLVLAEEVLRRLAQHEGVSW